MGDAEQKKKKKKKEEEKEKSKRSKGKVVEGEDTETEESEESSQEETQSEEGDEEVVVRKVAKKKKKKKIEKEEPKKSPRRKKEESGEDEESDEKPKSKKERKREKEKAESQRVVVTRKAEGKATAVLGTKKKAKEKDEESESEEDEDNEKSEGGFRSGPSVIYTRRDGKEGDGEEEEDTSEEEEEDEDEDEKKKQEKTKKQKKEAKKAKKEEKEKEKELEKKRRKEEKEKKRETRKAEKRKRREERKARKAERRRKIAEGLMVSTGSNDSLSGADAEERQRKVEAELWSEFVPFILRESHAGLFTSLSPRPRQHEEEASKKAKKPKNECEDDGSDESENESDVDTSSSDSDASTSTAPSDAEEGGSGSQNGEEVKKHKHRSDKKKRKVPAELEQLMVALHRFLTTVVCNAGFAGSDLFETTTGRLAGLSGLFAHPLGRNAFAVALKKLAGQNTSFHLTEEGFQLILCLIEQVINAFDFKRFETDLSVARVMMNIASTFHRTVGGSTQFVQQFITGYSIWRDLIFWEKYFWDELAAAQTKGSLEGRQDATVTPPRDSSADGRSSSSDAAAGDGDNDKSRRSSTNQEDAGGVGGDAAAEEEFVPFNPTLIFVLLHSTAYNMLNWDVDVRSVREFVTRMCKKTCLSHDQRQSIMEIVDSFAKSLLAPTEGSFDSVQKGSSEGSSSSSEDMSRKVGVRKKSSILSAPSSDAKADDTWSQHVLESVILELRLLTDEQASVMVQRAREREEEERKQKEKERKAAKKKGGKVEAGKKGIEKALGGFQEVQLVQRSRVIEELVNTEKSYRTNLMGIVQNFLEPFRKAKVVSEGEINLLFSNIEIIVELSQTFLTRLEGRLASWKADNRAPGEQFLSDIFALVFPFMKIYATYCGNFEDVNSYLHRNKNNDKLMRFIKQCEASTAHHLDLPSLLIMPVQRIPRYRLLLQELIKHTAPHHADHRKLCSALEMIKNIADFVNEQTRGSRLHTMQRNFGSKADSIVEPWRVWIKDGSLRALAIVEGGKVQIIPMYVILFNDLLVYAKSPKEYLGKVHLHEAWVKDEQDAGAEMQNILQFYSPSAAFLFAASSDEEKYEWIKALATNIDRQLQVDECREKRKAVVAEITKKKKKAKKQSKEKKGEIIAGGGSEDVVAVAKAQKKKEKRKKEKKAASEELLLSAFLLFTPNVIPNTANELLTTTQRIEKTFRTLSRHFSFRNVKEAPREEDKVKNDLDLATPPTLASSERQMPTRAGRPHIPPITPPRDKPILPGPLTAPARERSSSASSSSSSSSSSIPPVPQSPRKGGKEEDGATSGKKSFWGGLWSSNQVATSPRKGKQQQNAEGVEIFRK